MGGFRKCQGPVKPFGGTPTVGSGFARKRWSVRRTSSEDLPTAASPAWKATVRIREKSYLGTHTGNDKLQNVMPCDSGHSQLSQKDTESGNEIQQAVRKMWRYRSASTGGSTGQNKQRADRCRGRCSETAEWELRAGGQDPQ